MTSALECVKSITVDELANTAILVLREVAFDEDGVALTEMFDFMVERLEGKPLPLIVTLEDDSSFETLPLDDVPQLIEMLQTRLAAEALGAVNE